MKVKKKNKTQNVCIVYRPGKKEALSLARELTEWLADKKIKVYSHPKQKIYPEIQRLGRRHPPQSMDLIIVLGGDGTYLEAVRMLDGCQTPILGVNLGSLGFLTQNRFKDLYPVVNMALQNKMEMRPRTMLQIKVKRSGRIRKNICALNDIVIERGPTTQLIGMSLYSDQHFVCHIKADGVVTASPTGSTAYNLAAGGPILHPFVAAFVVTPIAPHSLTSRPLLFPDNQKLSYVIDEGQKAQLNVDGQILTEMTSKDEMTIQKSKHVHQVLRQPSHNYFQLLRDKLRFGERD